MAAHAHLQQLLAAIGHARGGAGVHAGPFGFGAPVPPPGVNPPPANSYRPAEFYRDTGHAGYAAQLWMSRHPFAVQNGHIPGWVSQAMTSQLGGAIGAHQQQPSGGTPNMGFGHYSGDAADGGTLDSGGGSLGGPLSGGYSPPPLGAPGTPPLSGGVGPGPLGGGFGGDVGGGPLGGGYGGGLNGNPLGGGGPIPLGPPVNGAPPPLGGQPNGGQQILGPNQQLAAQRALRGYA